ncbi:MAG: hypothetical protein AAB393_06220 [Bacteroidota bacterium]
MRIRRPHILLSLVLLVGLSGCGNGDGLSVKVESLLENLPVLEQTAAAWRDDAYLAFADVPLHNGNSSPWLIAAAFQSPSEDSESLLIMLQEDGSLTAQRIPHTVPVVQSDPITREDWALDSQEALEHALDEGGRTFLEDHSERQCSFLRLARDPTVPTEPVIWRLAVRDCEVRGFFEETIINPITGAVIRRK